MKLIKPRVIIVTAFCLAMAVSMHSILLKIRQENGMAALGGDLTSSLRSEIRFALSSYLWKKLDFYMHYSDWQKENTEDGGATYYSSLLNTTEFRPLIEWSVSIDPSFTEAICILANTFAVSLGRVSEGKEVLRNSILNHPDQTRRYRLYGEYGLIAYQVEKNYPQAVRFFQKSFQELAIIPPSLWSSEDRFNIRNYGLSAALSAFFLKEMNMAYQFHRLSGFEEGPAEFQVEMDKMTEAFGEVHLKSLHPLRHKKGASYHDHDHEPGEIHESDPEKMEEMQKALAAYKSDADIHLRMLPRLNPILFFPISWEFCVFLFGLSLLEIGLMIFWRMS